MLFIQPENFHIPSCFRYLLTLLSHRFLHSVGSKSIPFPSAFCCFIYTVHSVVVLCTAHIVKDPLIIHPRQYIPHLHTRGRCDLSNLINGCWSSLQSPKNLLYLPCLHNENHTDSIIESSRHL